MDEVLNGTIAYPFVDEKPLGLNRRQDKFVIKSITEGTEYVIEIPDAGNEYQIEIPLASLNADGSAHTLEKKLNPTTTDMEMIQSLPKVSNQLPQKSALLDKAFGVAEAGGPTEAPSYIMGMSRISQFYKDKKFEFALIEINQLLASYPNSPQLLKMKGTVYIKLRNLELAEKAYSQALEFTPYDKGLQNALKSLKDNITKREDRTLEEALQ